ncbi:MAG: TIM barrel protein, partial [Trichodesmium sp. MO_231.B1]|nr:TIM barrel protein [Trichodesmium sp. MO_231.B1]
MYPILNLTAPIGNLNHCGHIGHIVNDFAKICHLAYKYQFKGINIDLTTLDSLSIYEGKQLLNQFNLTPVSFGIPVNLFGSQKEFEEKLPEFELQAKQAKEIGCDLTLCYLPPFANDINFNDLFIQTSNRLRELKGILVENSLKIAFEFIGPTETRRSTKYDFIHTIDGTRALIASAGLYGYGGFKFDVHHWQNSGASVLDIHHLDLEYILYVELNDGLPGYDIFTIPEFERELPFTTGVTKVKEFLKALHQKGYQGPVAVEPWNQGIQNMSLENAIKTVKKSLDNSLQFISTLVEDPRSPERERRMGKPINPCAIYN